MTSATTRESQKSDLGIWDRSGWALTGTTIVVALVMYARPQEVSGQLILVAGTLLMVLLVSGGCKHPRPLFIPWLLVVIAASSALWADNSWNVITRAAALAVPLTLAGLIARNVPFERFLKIANTTLKTLVAVSLMVGLLVPIVGLTQNVVLQGTFRGIFIHRNHMGYVVILAVITLLASNWNSRKRTLGTIGWLAVYVLALSWTGSAGAVALVLTSLCIYALVRWLASNRTAERGLLLISLSCIAAFSLLVAIPYAPTILGLFGRDMTFTNRVGIWQGAVQAWEESFWLGYGWGSILGADDDAASLISRSSGWMVTSTHNGYLATALQLGAVGLFVSLVFLAAVMLKALSMVVVSPGPQAVWSLQIVTVLIIGDFTETRAFANVGWFLLCVVACYAAQRSPDMQGKATAERPSIDFARGTSR